MYERRSRVKERDKACWNHWMSWVSSWSITAEKAHLVLQNCVCWHFLKTDLNYLPCSEYTIPFSHFSALEGTSSPCCHDAHFWKYGTFIEEIGTAIKSSDQTQFLPKNTLTTLLQPPHAFLHHCHWLCW